MTPHQRIAINVIASYGRSLFSIACGIFSTRWVLMALGQTDFGLYGVVGSLAMFVQFLNIQFATAISRYFAFAIGQSQVEGGANSIRDEPRKWFMTAVCIHTLLPITLVLIGYPVGEYALRGGWVSVPPERLEACVWIWRFVCLSCFVAMINVPFTAMYTAKQYIAELTIYNVVQTAFRTLAFYYMACNPGDWLVRYGLVMCLVAIVPEICICVRATRVFPECTFDWGHLWDPTRLLKVVRYVVWQLIGSLGYVLRNNGVTVLINNMLGAKVNCAMGVGTTLGNETAILTGAFNGAIAPALTTAYGAGDLVQMRRLAFLACKVGLILTLVFALPLSLEAEEVLLLWLKTPPQYAQELCICLLACIVMEKATLGHVMAVNASGNVAAFQSAHGFGLMTALPVAGILLWFWREPLAVGVALIVTMAFSIVLDVLFARKSVGLGVKFWLFKIVLPLGVASSLAFGTGSLGVYFLEQSFLRIFITSILTSVVFCPLVWLWAFDAEERSFVKSRIFSRLRKRKSN